MKIIGVTPGINYENNSIFVKQEYLNAVIKAGGIPYIIPFFKNHQVLDGIIDNLSGILLTGGPDVDARYFGEDTLPCNGEIQPERDQLETYMVKKAYSMNLPLFAICRGIQMMNVALGGTIFQDIYTQKAECIQHVQKAPKWYASHKVNIESDSILSKCFEKKEIQVNSFHHQAIKELAPGFKVAATSSDGIIEAIESADKKFFMGVQWHPETMIERDVRMFRLFRVFLNNCEEKVY